MSRLKETYQNEIVDAMIKKFGYKNIMEVPKLDKIVINMGVGEAKENAKILEAAMKDLEIIAGQKPITTKAKNSIANFKIREGMPIGKFDTVVSRAVANLTVLSEWCIPFLKQGGYFLALKGPLAEQEVKDAKRAIKILGGQIEDIVEAEIPFTELKHKIIVIKKVGKTPLT